MLKKMTSVMTATLMLLTPLMTRIGSAETPPSIQVIDSPEEVIAQIFSDYNEQPALFRAEDMPNMLRAIQNDPSFSSEIKELAAAYLKLNDVIQKASATPEIQQMVEEKFQQLDALNNKSPQPTMPASDAVSSTNNRRLVELANGLTPEEKEALFLLCLDKVIEDTAALRLNVIQQMTEEERRISDIENLDSNVLTIIQSIPETTASSDATSLTKALIATADLLSAIVERPAFAADIVTDLTDKFNSLSTPKKVAAGVAAVLVTAGVIYVGARVARPAAQAAPVVIPLVGAASQNPQVRAAVSNSPLRAILNGVSGPASRLFTAIRDRFRPKEVRDVLERHRRLLAEGRIRINPDSGIVPGPKGPRLTAEQARQYGRQLIERSKEQLRAAQDLEIKIAKELAADRARIARQAREAAGPVKVIFRPTPRVPGAPRFPQDPRFSPPASGLPGVGTKVGASLPALAIPGAIGLARPDKPDSETPDVGVGGGTQTGEEVGDKDDDDSDSASADSDDDSDSDSNDSSDDSTTGSTVHEGDDFRVNDERQGGGGQRLDGGASIAASDTRTTTIDTGTTKEAAASRGKASIERRLSRRRLDTLGAAIARGFDKFGQTNDSQVNTSSDQPISPSKVIVDSSRDTIVAGGTISGSSTQSGINVANVTQGSPELGGSLSTAFSGAIADAQASRCAQGVSSGQACNDLNAGFNVANACAANFSPVVNNATCSGGYICQFQGNLTAPGTCPFGLVAKPLTISEYACVQPSGGCVRQGVDTTVLVCDGDQALKELQNRITITTTRPLDSGPAITSCIEKPILDPVLLASVSLSEGLVSKSTPPAPLCQAGYHLNDCHINSAADFGFTCIADQPVNPCTATGSKLISSSGSDSCCGF